MIPEALVTSIAYSSNLKLTQLTLLNLKSPQSFNFNTNIPMLGEKIASAEEPLKIKLSYYQVSTINGDNKESGEVKLSRAIKEYPNIRCYLDLI